MLLYKSRSASQMPRILLYCFLLTRQASCGECAWLLMTSQTNFGRPLLAEPTRRGGHCQDLQAASQPLSRGLMVRRLSTAEQAIFVMAR